MIIGLDVGGTHTDVVLVDGHGLEREIKVPTDPTNLFHSVLTGLTAITRDIDSEKIKRIVLSTTLTTNAIVQHKTPPVGMIVAGGPGIDPELYRMGTHYYPVAGAIDHRGREIEPVNPGEIKSVGDRLTKEGIRYVGVVGKFAVRNRSQELEIYRLLAPFFDKIFMSHHASGSLNFPRRIATTFLNASVYPIHLEFFQAVEKSLEARGMTIPLRLLKADGGNMKFSASIDCPAQTILSGPAASAMGAVALAAQAEDTLVMDIGGTTTDMAVLINRAPVLDPLGIELGGYKTLIRSLDTLSIGIGGDSSVKISDGNLVIGPERLGPAMAYGGPAPTPTDALAVMGNITDGNREKAARGIEPLAQKLGYSVKSLAAEIIDMTCKQILTAARQFIYRINSKPVYTVHELREGYVVQPKSILVLGGPAPYFADYLESLSDYHVHVVPRWKVANAIGAALARTTCEVTFFADTERGIAQAPEENFSQPIDHGYNADAALQQAFELLKTKAIARGANADHLEMELLELLQFNMVRGFNTIGKNIRVRVQVKPGLIQDYDRIVAHLG